MQNKNVIDDGEIKKSSSEGGKVQVTVNGEKMSRENLGCWKDSRNRAIQPIEGAHYLLKDNYHSRTDAVNKCLKAALAFGYTVFAVQNGGWCASAEDAEDTYKKYGRSGGCGTDGEGGGWANEVYKIERKLNHFCFFFFQKPCYHSLRAHSFRFFMREAIRTPASWLVRSIVSKIILK